jgi:hypothetical protein
VALITLILATALVTLGILVGEKGLDFRGISFASFSEMSRLAMHRVA